jgi:hypothetical protein
VPNSDGGGVKPDPKKNTSVGVDWTWFSIAWAAGARQRLLAAQPRETQKADNFMNLYLP